MLTASSEQSAQTVQEGDEVILFLSYSVPMRALTVRRGSQFSTREGFWDHERFIGKPFGSRVIGRHRNNSDIGVIPAPFLTVLRVNPELWSQALLHRTQIVCQTDISVIIAKLNLQPGKVIVEAGTGSGSLTHSLARTVAPTGRVYTFDFHKQRALTARDEFVAHELSGIVVSGWRDVCTTNTATTTTTAAVAGEQQEGGAASTTTAGGGASSGAGTIPEDEETPRAGYNLPPETADAAFLDVPGPWLAVENVVHVLKSGTGMVCSYSPCIEQTQRFCEALRRSDAFFDVHTVESLAREYVPIFTLRNDRRRLRDTNIGGDANNAAGGEAQQSATNNNGNKARGFVPRATDRGHTAYLTFATKKRRENA